MKKDLRILLAEDEDHIAKLVSYRLTREGYEVTTARDGQEALDLLDGHPWALIILDVMMPFYDGWHVLKKARASSRLEKVPVLMLTAKSLQKDMANAADLGATHFLKKPFDPAELASVVKKMVVPS